MSAERVLIRNGTVVTAEGQQRADILIREGAVEAVTERSLELDEARVVEAEDCWVIPGLVDPHCHFGTFSHHADDLGTLSTSALAGGVTTIIPFLIPGGGEGQPETLAGVLDHFVEVGRRDSLVDFCFHVALWPKWSAIEEIDACVEKGCTSFKMFMALARLGRMVPDDLLVAFMGRIRDTGALAMTHSENGLVTDYLEERLRESGRVAPTDLGLSRPPELEEEATFRAIALASVAGAPLYVVHVTSEGAASAIGSARSRGRRVAGETCPQYLTLDESAMGTWGPLAKVAPPLRSKDHVDFLWRALADGALSSLGSDHSAHLRSTKERGRENVFDDVPFGAATIESMLRVMVSEGVLSGRISLERLVAVASANPARIFGLYPQKGTLKKGSDGDAVVVDPTAEYVLTADRHHDRSGYSLYEGWKLKGTIRSVIASGVVRVEDGEILGPELRGRYLSRTSSGVPEDLA